MSKKIIRKLNNLKNPESFFQLNLIGGFKYIDKTGEIINNYNYNDKVDVGSNGLFIKNPKDKIDELRVSYQTVWMKFNQVDSLDMVSGLFKKESKDILNILDVNKINRIGWRNHFVFEFDSVNKRDDYFNNLTTIKDMNLSFIKFEVDTKKSFNLNLIIQPVVKNEDNTPSVLFDVDIYQSEDIDIKNVSKILDSFRKYINEGFLTVLNNTFK